MPSQRIGWGFVDESPVRSARRASFSAGFRGFFFRGEGELRLGRLGAEEAFVGCALLDFQSGEMTPSAKSAASSSAAEVSSAGESVLTLFWRLGEPSERLRVQTAVDFCRAVESLLDSQGEGETLPVSEGEERSASKARGVGVSLPGFSAQDARGAARMLWFGEASADSVGVGDVEYVVNRLVRERPEEGLRISFSAREVARRPALVAD